ncbi:MAG: hypothetical protein KDK89_19780 [Alphaproteobacteria bacterium]|nr:hypothetical protein [Alphaproteobacteria bacterium]
MTRLTFTLLAAGVAAAMAVPAAASGRSAADLALYRQAQRACQSWKYYPDGGQIHINYREGWFRCDQRHDRKRDKSRSSKN